MDMLYSFNHCVFVSIRQYFLIAMKKLLKFD